MATRSAKQRILALSHKYHTAEIARRVGVSSEYVRQVLKAAGITPVKALRVSPEMDKRNEAIRRLHSEGCTFIEAATSLNLNPSTLRNWCRDNNVRLKWKHGRINQQRIDEIKALAAKGRSKAEIAKHLGIPHASVSSYASRHLPDVVFKDGRK